MRTFTLSDLSRSVGKILDAAAVQPVAITRHSRPGYVMMSASHYASVTTKGVEPTGTSAHPEEPVDGDAPTQPTLF